MEKTIIMIESDYHTWYLDQDTETGVIRVSYDEKFKVLRNTIEGALEYVYSKLPTGRGYLITRY